MEEGKEGEAVTVEAEAGDDALADGRQEGLVAEWLARVDVADMNLDHGSGDGSDSVGDGNRSVGVAAGVEHDATVVKAHRLQAVDNLPLDVALIYVDIVLRELVNIDRVLRELVGQLLQILVERAVAINLGLTFAHEVQVGAVDDVDGHFLK